MALLKIKNMTNSIVSRVFGVVSRSPYAVLPCVPRHLQLFRSYRPSIALNKFSHRTFEDDLFKTLGNGKDTFLLSYLTTRLKQSGLMPDDQRLSKLFEMVKLMKDDSKDDVLINLDQFRALVKCNRPLLYKTFTNNLVISQFNELVGLVNDLYWKCLKNVTGTATSSSRLLASETLDKWCVSICTIDGQRHSIGHSSVPVVSHSCSDIICYALAAQEHDSQTIKQYIADEPLFKDTNKNKCLDLSHLGIPHNPLSVAGTLVTTSLLSSNMSYDEKLSDILNKYRAFTGGGDVTLSEIFYKYQKGTCDNIWANAYHLSDNLCFPAGTDLERTVDLYLKLQSVQMSSEDFSVLAATLANGGVCPITGDSVLRMEETLTVVSIMFTCGISGKFALEVGVPSVSGISGGLMAVVPGIMGMFMWSPLLNSEGISVRGLQFCENLSKILDLHYFGGKISGHSKEKVFEIESSRAKRHETKMSTAVRPSHIDIGLRMTKALFAANKNDITALRTLYLADHDMNLADYDGRTPLHVAVCEGKMDAVKFLVEKCGANVNVKDIWDSTPLDDAKKFKRSAIELYLTNHLSRPNVN